MNLALNAKDAMEKGGVLRFITYPEDGEVVVEVQDTGCGIAPDIIDTIFEPFFPPKKMAADWGYLSAMASSRNTMAL